MTNVAMMIENENARIWEEQNNPMMDEDLIDSILIDLEKTKRLLSDAEDELVGLAEMVEGNPLEDRINSIRDGVNQMWDETYRLREKIRKGAI